MLKKIKSSFFKKLKIFRINFINYFYNNNCNFILTIKKKLIKIKYNNFINNIYFKKTLNEIVNNLEPRYKKYNHKIKSGETFDKILK